MDCSHFKTGTLTSDDIASMVTSEVAKIVPNVPVDTITSLIQQELSKLSLSVNVAPAQQVTSPQPVSVSPTEVAS